jgi:hypothetical protein
MNLSKSRHPGIRMPVLYVKNYNLVRISLAKDPKKGERKMID